MLRHRALNSIAPVSFIGAGIQPPNPSWGNMLADAYQTIDRMPWLSIAPGLSIFLLVLSVNLLGDTPRDILDPHLKTG